MDSINRHSLRFRLSVFDRFIRPRHSHQSLQTSFINSLPLICTVLGSHNMNQHKRRICFAGLKTNVQPQAAHLCSSPSMNMYVAIGAHCVIPPVVEFLMLSYISCIVCILRLHLYLIGRDDRATLTIYKTVYCRQKFSHRLFYTTVS